MFLPVFTSSGLSVDSGFHQAISEYMKPQTLKVQNISSKESIGCFNIFNFTYNN